MVEIRIIDNGKEQILTGDCAYGCIIENVTKEDGEQGVRCMSFLSGGNVNMLMLPEVMTTSVAKVITEMCKSDPLMAPMLVGAAVAAMDQRATELIEQTEDLRNELKEEFENGGN